MPARKDFECRGCRHADIVINTIPTCRGNNYCNVLREATVWCKEKKQVIRYPNEHCTLKDQAPKLTLKSFV